MNIIVLEILYDSGYNVEFFFFFNAGKCVILPKKKTQKMKIEKNFHACDCIKKWVFTWSIIIILDGPAIFSRAAHEQYCQNFYNNTTIQKTETEIPDCRQDRETRQQQ